MPRSSLKNGLEPINTPTMVDLVESRLLEYFKKKPFLPGDSLPTELEMAETLGVSRNILREGLSRLRMLGLVESKKKRGMVLSKPDILGAFERVLNPLVIDKDILQDVFELRLVLEMGLADLLYLRKTDKDIKELEKIAREETKHNEEEFRIKTEIDFHGKLYEMSGNTTLKRFQSMLIPIFGYVITLEKKPIRGKISHLDLVNILKDGSKEDFKEGMYEHLKPHFERLKMRKREPSV